MLTVKYKLCTTDDDVDGICCDVYNGNDDGLCDSTSSINTIEHTEDRDDVGVTKIYVLPDKHDGTLLLNVVDAGEYGIFVSC